MNGPLFSFAPFPSIAQKKILGGFTTPQQRCSHTQTAMSKGDHKIKMGLVLKEKEKALIDILSRHPKYKAKLDAVQVKVDADIIANQYMRTRTHRYEDTDSDTRDDQIKSSVNDHQPSMDLQLILDQTLADMKQLRQERDEEVGSLKSKLDEALANLEEAISRADMVKHYGYLLIKSVNIYAHKSINEVSESDRVRNRSLKSLKLVHV
jgi:hypothetical protein